MKRTEGLRPWTMLLVGLAMILPPGLLAQDAAELDRMHDWALAAAYEGTSADIQKATWMHSQVVQLRTADDPRRFECLRDHANLLYYIGYVDGARVYLEEAAQHAANTGDDFNAAMTFVDAAILALEAGNIKATQNLAERAALMSTSPRLDRQERATILDRIIQ